jgi:hypothetical protein
MTKVHCPNVLAAAAVIRQHEQAAEGGLWRLGAALIKDCGGDDAAACRDTGMRSKANNGSKALLSIAAAELKAEGYDYSEGTLRQIRDTALAFPKKEDRVEGLGFWTHKEAVNPEVLRWVLKHVKVPKSRIGYFEVRAAVVEWRKRLEAKTKVKHEQAQFKKRAAKTEAEREAAEEEIEATRSPPKGRDMPAPEKQDSPVLLLGLTVGRLAREAKSLAKQAQDRITGADVVELDQRALDYMADETLSAMNEWQKVADMVRKASPNKRGHLREVS